MENMEYYTQRLQCSDEEKDACLETVAKIFRLRLYIHRSGRVAAQIFAEKETDPFFAPVFKSSGKMTGTMTDWSGSFCGI